MGSEKTSTQEKEELIVNLASPVLVGKKRDLPTLSLQTSAGRALSRCWRGDRHLNSRLSACKILKFNVFLLLYQHLLNAKNTV